MLEPDNWMGYENREGFRDPIPEYVFFCEGVSEKQLVALLHKRFRNNVNLIAYAIPSPEQNDENKFFTPKRIADYCERILKYAQNGTVDNNGLYEYADYTADGVNNFGDNQQTVIQDLHQGIVTQICILVDTDVFFKTSFEHKHGDYYNLQDKRYYDNLDDIPGDKVKDCFDYFTEEERPYRFCEQELTFEDFFVILFGEDGEFEDWFDFRFQRGDACARDYDGTRNDIDNSESIKQLLDDRLHCGDRPVAWVEYKRFNVKQCIMRCINRMERNKRLGLPYRYGIIDILRGYINNL